MHISVLKKEALEFLNPGPNENFIDATVNGGGHALEILAKTAPEGKLLAIDLDKDAIAKFEEKISENNFKQRVVVANDNFARIKDIVREKDFSDIAGIIADLGFSSWQIEESGRGFSFLKDEPLLMTLSGASDGLTAYEIVNGWPEERLKEVIREYGEERFAGRIARNIKEARRNKKITTTKELVEIIEKAVPGAYQRAKIHSATRTFQALRITVNDELSNLRVFLENAFDVLQPGGRLVIISFHSLEDRIVKNFFKEKKLVGQAEVQTKKPIIPSDEEIKANPRSRSAKLRALIKIS